MYGKMCDGWQQVTLTWLSHVISFLMWFFRALTVIVFQSPSPSSSLFMVVYILACGIMLHLYYIMFSMAQKRYRYATPFLHAVFYINTFPTNSFISTNILLSHNYVNIPCRRNATVLQHEIQNIKPKFT